MPTTSNSTSTPRTLGSDRLTQFVASPRQCCLSNTVKNLTLSEWARLCRIEAMRTTHEATRALLVDLAAEYEAMAGRSVDIDPDDRDLQNAVADRLSLAAKRNASKFR